MTLYTVDVFSESDDSIIKDPHAKGVIVKATQGTGYVNPKCNHQVALAKSLGKKLGYYHYAGGGDPTAEADYFLANIKNYIGTGMLVVDWESYQNSAWGDTTWVRRFVDRVHDKTGVWPVIYVQESAIWQVANCAKDCGLWVAKYASMNWNSWTVPDMPVSSGAFAAITGWQYTGGDMDRSIWYIDESGWDKFAKANTANPAPQLQPQPQSKSVSAPKTWADDLGVVWHEEKATFTLNTAINLRWGATTKSALIATLPAGSEVEYDAWAKSGGYIWIRQPRGNGQFGYLVCRDSNGQAFGTFK